MTFKEMADEFMLKLKIVSEQKDELTNSYLVLQEEGIVLRERLRAEWAKEVEETVEYQCIMDVFTLSSLSAQVRAICVNNIKNSCPK